MRISLNDIKKILKFYQINHKNHILNQTILDLNKTINYLSEEIKILQKYENKTVANPKKNLDVIHNNLNEMQK